MTSQSGRSLNLRCPYQANVMKTFEQMSRAIGRMRAKTFAIWFSASATRVSYDAVTIIHPVKPHN